MDKLRNFFKEKMIIFLKKILGIQSPSKNKTYIYYEEKVIPCNKNQIFYKSEEWKRILMCDNYYEWIDRLKGERMSKAVIQLPHPSIYILDVLHEGFKHIDPDDNIRIGFTKDELEYLIECVKEKEEKNGDFNSNS